MSSSPVANGASKRDAPKHDEVDLTRLIRFTWPFVWPVGEWSLRARVILAFALLIAAKLVNIAVPFFLKDIVDGLSLDELVTVPLFALIGYGLARLGAQLFRELRDAVFAKVGQRAGRRLAAAVYEHLFSLSLRYHLQRRTGELARAIDRGVKALSFLLRAIVFNLAPTIFEFAVVIGILWVNYPPAFAGVTFVTILAYAAFTVATTNWRTIIRREMNKRDNEFNAAAVDGLINYEVVKAFGNEGFEQNRLDTALAAYERAAVKSDTTLAFLNTGQAGLITVGVTILMIMAAQGVVDGTMTVGDVVLLNAFLLQLYQPLNFLGVVYREIRQSITDLENIQGILALEPDVQDSSGAATLNLDGGRIRFNDVHFAYDERRPILQGMNFTIEPGTKLAVVGPSGAGKSTIVRLLFRFYDPQAGQILIDDQPIQTATQTSLRHHIGLVPQDTVLFNDTIAKNIAYGRTDASQSEIEEAARQAQIDTFIQTLPDGYDTIVGERGLKLSGGEKQRVAIARVLLKDPPILVLDEATSALDSRTEQQLQGALERASRGRTTLVIAHRLSTVTDADRIVVLNDGQIAETGNHNELIAKNGLYAELWRRQRADQGADQGADETPIPINDGGSGATLPP